MPAATEPRGDTPVVWKDREWSRIDGQLCLVTEFSPMATMEDGEAKAISPRTPYASVELGIKTRDGGVFHLRGYVCHKMDFAMLWAAFRDRAEVPGVRMNRYGGGPVHRTLAPEEEVNIVWTRSNYRLGVGLLRWIMPKLVVYVRPKGAFMHHDKPNEKPNLTGGGAPLLSWTPEVIRV